MKQLWDEIDEEGNVVVSGIVLIPGLTLPPNHKWIHHTPNLSTVKILKKNEIDIIRSQECFKPVEALGFKWQADQRSQDLLSSAILLAEVGAAASPPTWRTLDNKDVEVTLEDLKTIAGNIAQHTQEVYQYSWTLKNRIEQAVSQEEVDNISWQI